MESFHTWKFLAEYSESDHGRLMVELAALKINYKLRHDPNQPKPYRFWVHEEDLKLAKDRLFKGSS